MSAVQRALVVGAGSIGRRHLGNLAQAGVPELFVCDPDGPATTRAAQEHGAIPVGSVEHGLQEQPELVMVCTPPHLHVDPALAAVHAGAHVFVEKPLAASLEGVQELVDAADRAGRPLHVGYNLRFHPGIRRLRALLDAGAIGRLLSIRAEVGTYLPDWRPGTDYRTNYIARAGTGGGIILDASHELDYVRWLAGEVTSVSAVAEHVSDLELETEDLAAITLRHESGAIGEVHLDCLQRAYSRTCKLIGAEGTVEWDFTGGVRVFRPGDGWAQERIDAPVDDMYRAELAHVLACVRDGGEPAVDGHEALRVLRIALAARESAASHREVAL